MRNREGPLRGWTASDFYCSLSRLLVTSEQSCFLRRRCGAEACLHQRKQALRSLATLPISTVQPISSMQCARKALKASILALCKNTRLKHRLVDAAAVSSGLALLATMCLVVILLIDSTWL